MGREVCESGKREESSCKMELEEDMLLCKLCMSLYADGEDRKPRKLGCGHSFCHRCVNKFLLPEKSLCKTTAPRKEELYKLKCPLCRMVTVCGRVGDLMVNDGVMAMLAVVKSKLKKEETLVERKFSKDISGVNEHMAFHGVQKEDIVVLKSSNILIHPRVWDDDDESDDDDDKSENGDDKSGGIEDNGDSDADNKVGGVYKKNITPQNKLQNIFGSLHVSEGIQMDFNEDVDDVEEGNQNGGNDNGVNDNGGEDNNGDSVTRNNVIKSFQSNSLSTNKAPSILTTKPETLSNKTKPSITNTSVPTLPTHLRSFYSPNPAYSAMLPSNTSGADDGDVNDDDLDWNYFSSTLGPNSTLPSYATDNLPRYDDGGDENLPKNGCDDDDENLPKNGCDDDDDDNLPNNGRDDDDLPSYSDLSPRATMIKNLFVSNSSITSPPNLSTTLATTTETTTATTTATPATATPATIHPSVSNFTKTINPTPNMPSNFTNGTTILHNYSSNKTTTPTFPQQTPTFSQQTPTFSQQTPTFPQQTPTFPQKTNAFNATPTIQSKGTTLYHQTTSLSQQHHNNTSSYTGVISNFDKNNFVRSMS